MTENKPTPPQPFPPLIPWALSSWRALFWLGLALIAVAVVAVIIYINIEKDDLHGMFLWAALAAGALPSGAALLTGAGIVAALGKRQQSQAG